MKISIITPTHNPKFLKELEDTILGQTFKNWEWIIMLNQGAKFEASDPRIKITECPFVSNSVGFMKRLACMQASGDIIAEVDHDDLLVPDCLAKVAEAFNDPEVGFVYSINAKLSKDFRPYLPEYGWSFNMFRWKGRDLYAMNNQPLYPGRLGHIYFAPDHIRAWRRSVYESIGGHDDTLQVCDDLDLMHRLYKVTRFKEIPEVLYIYRINGDNTFMRNGKLIEETDTLLYEKDIESLARRFSEINDLRVIDLELLKTQSFGQESYFTDFTFTGIPDGSVGLIKAKNVLQYVKDPQRFMAAVHRVLAPGGMILTSTPSSDGRGAFQDPGAVSFWNENSFWYYTRKEFAAKIGNTALFRRCRIGTVYPDDFCKEHKIPFIIAHLEKLPS